MKQLLLTVLLLCSILVFGQSSSNSQQAPSLPEIIPPSPTVASLMTFEEVPVDYYTGQPDISIPIYSKKLNAEMTLPIALKYNTQGIKVASRSGWTGTGWSLEAGGSISRTVRGVADEADKNNNILTGIYNLPTDEFFSYSFLDDYEKNKYSWYANGTASDKYDSELDLYQFSILGITGRFVITKRGPDLFAKLLTKDQNIKIEIIHDTINVGQGYYKVTEITGFIITDANGYKYFFGGNDAIETTTSTPYSASVPQTGTGGGPDLSGVNKTTIHISAWHLSKITTNNGEELASFNYITVNESYRELENRTEYNLDNNTKSTYLGSALEFEGTLDPNIDFNNSMFYPKSITSGASTSVSTKKLSQLIFRDNTKITFNTSGTHPEYLDSDDHRSGTVLTGINLYSASNYLWKTFTFSYTENNRLWLDKVKESTTSSLTGIPAHNLEYKLEYVSKSLPDFGHGDSWGYKYVEPKWPLVYIRNHLDGVLKRIIYPTGGVKDFKFEPHTYSYEGNQLLPEEETDKNPLNSNLLSNSVVFESNGNNGGAPTPAYSNIFTINYSQAVRFSINVLDETPPNNYNDGVAGSDHYWLKVINTNTGATIYRMLNDFESQPQIGLDEGTYKYTISYSINEYPSTPQYVKVGVSVRYGNKKFGKQYSQFLVGGGLRIKEINFRENDTTAESEKKLMYFYNTPYDAESSENLAGNITMLPELEPGFIMPFPDPSEPHVISSGAVDGRSGSYSCEYSFTDQAFLKTIGSGFGGGFCSLEDINYSIITTQQNKQLTKGSFVSYKHVRVRELNKGYSYYNYKTPQDEPLTWSKCEYPFRDFPNIDYKRGWLLEKKVFNEQNQLLVEELNTYELREDDIAITRPLSSVPCAWIKCYTNLDQYLEGTNPNIDTSCSLNSNSTPPYNCGGTTPYIFGKQDLIAGSAPLKTKVKKEYFIDGEEVTMTQTQTDYEYNPVNYQVSSESVTIEEGVGTAVYKTEYEYPVGGYVNSLFTTEENNVIDQMGDDITDLHVINKPIVIASYRNNEPLQKTINKYKIVAGQPVLKEVETLKSITSEGEDRIVYHKYDNFGNPLDVSMKEGTHISYIWGYNHTFPAAKIEGVAYDNIPVTLRDNIIQATNPNPAGFSEADLIAAQNALREHYEQPLSTVGVTTLVYEPARGVVTSVTDPRGDVLHYEYDNLGRLLMVKDKDNHLLSRNEYHYRTEQ